MWSELLASVASACWIRFFCAQAQHGHIIRLFWFGANTFTYFSLYRSYVHVSSIHCYSITRACLERSMWPSASAPAGASEVNKETGRSHSNHTHIRAYHVDNQ